MRPRHDERALEFCQAPRTVNINIPCGVVTIGPSIRGAPRDLSRLSQPATPLTTGRGVFRRERRTAWARKAGATTLRARASSVLKTSLPLPPSKPSLSRAASAIAVCCSSDDLAPRPRRACAQGGGKDPRLAFAGLKLNVFVDDRLNIGSRKDNAQLPELVANLGRRRVSVIVTRGPLMHSIDHLYRFWPSPSLGRAAAPAPKWRGVADSERRPSA